MNLNDLSMVYWAGHGHLSLESGICMQAGSQYHPVGLGLAFIGPNKLEMGFLGKLLDHWLVNLGWT